MMTLLPNNCKMKLNLVEEQNKEKNYLIVDNTIFDNWSSLYNTFKCEDLNSFNYNRIRLEQNVSIER